MTVQDTIDDIITYIDAAITKHSVSNRHVALVLSFLNEELKKTKTSFDNINGKFLSKVNEDSARKLIKFAEGLKSLGDVTIGEYLEQGDTIQGAKITKEGHGSFASLKSSYMEIFELLLNKQTAVGGEFKISDVGTIEEVTYLLGQEEPYTEIKFADYNRDVHGRPWGAILRLREEYEGYLTTFKYDDIVYGSVNGMGKSGGYSIQGQFFGVVKNIDKCTLRVNIYSDKQVPTGTNLLPVPHMVITQRGNETNKERQSVITLSAPDKSMVILNGVDSPVLDAKGHCYGISFGKLPDSLYSRVQKAFPYLGVEDMSVYAKNLIVQNLMLMDHLDQPIKTERYRGAWSESVANGEVPDVEKYRLTDTIYDTVTYAGSKWQCLLDGTTAEPGERTTEWGLIVGKGGDGQDGKDGVSPNENLLGYSSDFSQKWELYDSGIVAGLNGHKAIYRKCEVEGGHVVHNFASYAVTGVEDAKLVGGEWYTLSFYGKSSDSLYLPIFILADENAGVVDSTSEIYVDGISTTGSTNGNANIKLSTEWEHHTYTFKTLKNLGSGVGKILFGDRAKGEYYVSMPKLELGKIATPWCKSESDKTAYGINSVSTEYMVTDSFERPDVSDDEWSAQFPNVAVGQYLWTKVVTDYTGPDIEDTVVITVSRAGADGTSITVTDVSYAKNENATTPPESGWRPYPYPLSEGEYLWTRTTFSDRTHQYTVSKNGDNLKISSIQYAKTSDKNADPSRLEYSDTVPTSEPGFYIWTKTTYSDGQIDYAPAYLPNDGVSPNENILDGTSFEKLQETGIPLYWSKSTSSLVGVEVVDRTASGIGKNAVNVFLSESNADGSTIYHAFYQNITNKLSASTWYVLSFQIKSTLQNNFTARVFLQNLPDNSKGVYCDGKLQLSSGDNLGAYVTVTEGWKKHYIVFQTKTETKDVISQLGFALEKFSEQSYLLSQIKLEAAYDVVDPAKVVPTPWCASTNDLAAAGIQSVTTSYGVSNSPTSMPTSWKSELSEVTVGEGQYLWIQTITDYTDPSMDDTITYSYSKQGANGVTITGISYQQGDSATVAPTGTWSSKVIAVEQGKYLWVKTTYSNGTSAYSVSYNSIDGLSPGENLFDYSSDFSAKWDLNSNRGQIVAGLNGHKALYRKCELTNHPHEFARYIVTGTEDAVLNKGEWYTLSFYSKGAGTLALFIKTNVTDKYVVDKEAGVYLDGIYKSTNAQGATNINLTEEWVHHTYTFKTANSLDEVGRIVFGDRSEGEYYVCMPKLEYGKNGTSWGKSPKDLTGPAGSTGPMLVPYGDWEEGPEDSEEYAYSLIMDVDDSTAVVGRPMVYYAPNDDAEGVYYVLQQSIKGKDNTVENLRNIEYWRPFLKTKYIFTEALMANWGKLASAIFYSDYMFSAYGTTKDGALRSFKDFIGGANPMFTGNEKDGYRLSGILLPNLFTDFLTGMIKTNKLSETLAPYVRESAVKCVGTNAIEYTRVRYANEIEYKSSYNIRVDYDDTKVQRLAYNYIDNNNKLTFSTLTDDIPNKIITMPNLADIKDESYPESQNWKVLVKSQSWEPDGVHATIIVEADAEYTNEWAVREGEVDNTATPSSYSEYWSAIMQRATILCADARLFDQYSYRRFNNKSLNRNTIDFAPNSSKEYQPGVGHNTKHPSRNMFVVNGVFTKFLFLEPGTIVRLRSCTSKGAYYSNNNKTKHVEDVTLWYVENASDFSPVSVNINLQLACYYEEVSHKLLSVSEAKETYKDTFDDEAFTIVLGGTNVVGNNYGGTVTVFGTNRMAKMLKCASSDTMPCVYDVELEKPQTYKDSEDKTHEVAWYDAIRNVTIEQQN